MRFASATDLAISLAVKAGTLKVEECKSRFGDTFIAISDDRGLIEVHGTRAEAEARIARAS